MKRPLALALLSEVRQEIVMLLKKRGPRDMETLADELFLSVGAVRQNLAALAAQGIVDYTVERSGPGRPRHIYHLRAGGRHVFPEFYDEIAEVLLSALDEESPEVAPRVYSRAAELLFGNLAARLEGKHGRDRIAAIVAVLEEYGYLPEVSHRESGAEEITIFHCPLLLLARRHPGTCEAELRCLQMAAPGADVTRVAHRNSGDGICSFVFRQN